jgi:chromosome transmission fidelity protein 1
MLQQSPANLKIVTLPYPLLLQQSTRESLGLDLTDHVVIIDEAHNLIDAISALHSTTLTQSQIIRGITQLETYLGKFTSRLGGRNKMFIKQILALLRRLDSFLTAKKNSSGQVTAAELLLSHSTGGLDQINFYKVEKYLRISGLARKVEGYTTISAKEVKEKAMGASPSTPVLMILQSFLVALNSPRREGRIFYQSQIPPVEGMQFRYLLLDVSLLFADLVKSARAVILAGGTMSPLPSYITALLPDVPKEKLLIYSFPHIIPPENLVVSTLGKGPTGKDMCFDFTRREDAIVMQELGMTIAGLAGLVREGGVVVFVPSYAYLDQLFKSWEQTILPKLQAKRKVQHSIPSHMVPKSIGLSGDANGKRGGNNP